MGRRTGKSRDYLADDVVLYGESKVDLRAMVRRLVDMCRKRGLRRQDSFRACLGI